MIFYLLLSFSIFTEIQSSTISEVAVNIANSEFKYRKTTTVVWQKADTEVVTDFLTKYQGCVETFDMNNEQNNSIAFEQTVLYVTSTKEFTNFVKNMDTSITNPSKVVAVMMDFNNDLSNITIIAFSYDITDIIIIIQDETKMVQMYTYYPFSELDCENTTPVKVNKGVFFPSKFKNLFGCEIRLGSTSVQPYNKVECFNGTAPFVKGLCGELFSLIANHMNAKLTVVCASAPNNILLDLLRNKTISVYTPVVLTYEYLKGQYAPVFFFLESIWCGPPQREIYAWAKVLLPMMNNITILLGVTYFTLVAVLKISNRVERNRMSSHIAWNALAIILGQQAEYESSSSLRNYLFALWLWFSMVITIAYQGVLVKGLQTKYLEPRFDTIESAINLVDAYGGSHRQRSLYEGTPIWDKFSTIRVPEMIASLGPISRGKRFIVLTSRLTAMGYKDLQILEKPVSHLALSAAMTPRWGGSVDISSTQTKLVEAGFFLKFQKDEELRIVRREAMLNNESSGSTAGHLDFVTMSSCFYVLGVMGLVCLLILLMEILVWRYLRGDFQTRLDKLHAA